MDCTIFDWEANRQPVPLAGPHAESRALLQRHLRLAYAVARDDAFADLVHALDQPRASNLN